MSERFVPIPDREYGGIQRARTLEAVAPQEVQDAPQKQSGPTRRSLLFGAAALGVTAAAGVHILRESEQASAESEVGAHEPEEETIEVVEALPSSERFEGERLGWQKWWELKYDQVLFLDEHEQPVGEPVDFQEFVVKRTRTGDDGLPVEYDYLLTPGATDENGMLEDNIAGEWLRFVRARHAQWSGVDANMLQQRNITEEFEKAVDRADDEPLLRESIIDAVRGGNGIETMIDLVEYYGMNEHKTVRGDEQGRTRATYLKEEIAFHNSMPQLVQDQLRGFIVALAAQESRFNAGLPKNHATAMGIMQLVDAVRGEHGFDTNQRLSFREEVDVAGKHFSNIYKRIKFWMQHEHEKGADGRCKPKDTYARLTALFGEGEEKWQTYFLVPCMINAYNAGSLTIGECLHDFVANHTDEQLQEMCGDEPGYDLYQQFTHFAKESNANRYTQNYGEDAQAYFLSIAGAAEGLKNSPKSAALLH